MNEVVNKSLFSRDKFLSEIHSRQPWFTYNACGTFTKSERRIQKFNGIRNSKYIYQNKLNKACFQHDITYRDFKELPGRIVY